MSELRGRDAPNSELGPACSLLLYGVLDVPLAHVAHPLVAPRPAHGPIPLFDGAHPKVERVPDDSYGRVGLGGEREDVVGWVGRVGGALWGLRCIS